MHLALATIIQKFDLHLADPSSYSLTFNFTLTVKPVLNIRAVPRKGRHVILPVASSALRQAREGLTPAVKTVKPEVTGSKQPLYVLYGSNTGSCESFAQKIANAAPTYGEHVCVHNHWHISCRAGFSAQMGTMDSASRNLPTDGPVVIISASYEGMWRGFDRVSDD
jgi:cytochrome P450/NADPH-cytochrome P450 reductase